MKIEEFRAMFFTAFGRIPEAKKQTIYDLLLPMIRVDQVVGEGTLSSKEKARTSLPSLPGGAIGGR